MPATASLSSPPANDLPSGDDDSLSSLLGGIVDDIQDLMEDHLHLMKLEVEDDLQKSKDALLPMVLGGSLMLAAFILLMATLIGWLTYIEPSLHWFGWAGIVGLVTAAIAGVLLLIAQRKWHFVHPIPEKTLRRVKKTIKSISEQVNTDKS